MDARRIRDPKSTVVIALVAWMALTLAILWVGLPYPRLACMKLVGRSDGCVARQYAAHEAWWWSAQAPLIASVTAGYLVIGVLLTRTRRVERRLRGLDVPEVEHERG